MPGKKKKFNARFPPARIKKIMQTDEEVGKVAAAVPVIISRAVELFVYSLLQKTGEISSAKHARTLTPAHLKQCINGEKRFSFLQELVSKVPDLGTGDEDDLLTPSTFSSLYFPPSSESGSSVLDDTTEAHTVDLISKKKFNSRKLKGPSKPRGRPPKTVLLNKCKTKFHLEDSDSDSCLEVDVDLDCDYESSMVQDGNIETKTTKKVQVDKLGTKMDGKISENTQGSTNDVHIPQNVNCYQISIPGLKNKNVASCSQHTTKNSVSVSYCVEPSKLSRLSVPVSVIKPVLDDKHNKLETFSVAVNEIDEDYDA